jgi:hypothetical protein
MPMPLVTRSVNPITIILSLVFAAPAFAQVPGSAAGEATAAHATSAAEARVEGHASALQNEFPPFLGEGGNSF